MFFFKLTCAVEDIPIHCSEDLTLLELMLKYYFYNKNIFFSFWVALNLKKLFND